MHLDGFIIRIYHDARSLERQIPFNVFVTLVLKYCDRNFR